VKRPSRSRFSASFLSAALCICVLPACSRTDSSSASSSTLPTAPAASASRGHDIRGEIVTIDRPRKTLLIHHEEIPGYMPAMTMEFSVAGVDLATLREGQRIAAHMGEPVDGIFPLTRFRIVPSPADEAVTAAAPALRQDTHTRGRDAFREVGEIAPSFTLYNQDGKAVAFDHFRGKRVVMNFIFTRCPVATMCPASTAKMMALQAAAKRTGIKNLEFVSISFDSAYDTPPVLKKYASDRGIDTTNFTFLTGPEPALRDLLAQFGVIAEPGENLFKHTLSTLLIGPDGKILHRATESNWSTDEFLNRLPLPTP
jgi:protein SCO1